MKTDIAFRSELVSLRNSKRVTQKEWHPGCTAVAALIVRNRLFVANAGDCRTIICHGGHPCALSKVMNILIATSFSPWFWHLTPSTNLEKLHELSYSFLFSDHFSIHFKPVHDIRANHPAGLIVHTIHLKV